MKKITKAVFPVAGLGTRFLPVTKATAKEMLPIVDKPLIQFAVEEAVDAGITDMVFVTGRTKRAIEDHFDKAYELETELELRGKQKLLDVAREVVPSHINCIYVRQPEALGLGHAVLCARPVVGHEPFAVVLADDLIDSSPGALKEMVDVYEREACSVIAVENVAREDTSSYGIVDCGDATGAERPIKAIVEKPEPAVAPSTLAVVGRYLLTEEIFGELDNVTRGAGGEIQLTDAIAALLGKQRALAYSFNGTRYDCGSKLGYLQANIQFGLRHPEVGDGLRAFLRNIENQS
ncbi:MAG: UTP--glucose-1-phosphate uridylyltransferase GalU [Betaproteobacteria bacterium]|nr:MAG: UTP--glucose-1-phosphate uridylyltransferase GalU [Betaproteobacteria bacterium]